MRLQKNWVISVMCWCFGSLAIISFVQAASDEPMAAGAKLVVTAVAGPATADHNRTISVICRIKNTGSTASGAYQVDLYLSRDKTLDPAADRLLKNVVFSTGLAPGVVQKATVKVLVPVNGLAGDYYYGAVAGNSRKTSVKQVSFNRFSLTDNNETVTDHQTGLVWQRADDGVTRSWAEAKQYCADLVLGGKSDWRLPDINESVTIIDYSRTDPAIDPVFKCRPENYWSSTKYVYDPDNVWYVLFYRGFVYADFDRNSMYVRCVCGVP